MQRTHQDLEATLEKGERQRESIQQRLVSVEKDLQQALEQERQSHEEDVTRLSQEKVKFVYLVNLVKFENVFNCHHI